MVRNTFKQSDYLVIVVAILFTLLLIYVVSINGIRANQTLLEAIRPQTEGVAKNLKFFKKALNYDYTVGIMETREQLAYTASQITGAEMPRETQMELFTLAQSEMKKQIEKVPNDARYRMFLANILLKFGFPDEAISQIKEGLRVSPKKQILYYQLNQAYTVKGDVEKGLDALRLALDAEPTNTTARKEYAAYAIRIGRDALAEEILAPAYGTATIDDQSIINAYVARGQFDKVAKIWEKRINDKPNNPQYHLSLGAAYAKAGKRQEAIAAVRKAIELAPDFKEQGEEIIRRIRTGDI